MIKYFLYTRKSTEEAERQALSLSSQLDKAKELFGHLDIIVLPPESASAFTPDNRPIFADMLKRIDCGEAQGVIAWHPDRLSRNELDAAAITYRVRTGKIIDLKFGSYNFDNSPEGIMMLQMTMSQSQYSSAKLSKDVKRGIEKKIDMGWKPGWAPTGYLNTTDRTKGSRIIIQDPERFNLVRRMWDLMLTGNYTVPQILNIANNEWGFRTKKTLLKGGKPLSRSALYSIFNSLFYCGFFNYDGKVYEGSHDKMVTEEEFDLVQRILGRKGRPRPIKRVLTYRGTMFCGECGCSITGEVKAKYIQSADTTRTYTYYHCTRKRPCKQRGSITEEKIDKEIMNALEQVSILPELARWATEVINENAFDEAQKIKSVLNNTAKSINETKGQIDNLTGLRIRNLLTDEEYIRQKNKLQDQLKMMESSLKQTNTNSANDEHIQIFNFASNASNRFSNGSMQEKRDILSALGKKATILNNQLNIDLNEWFLPIKEKYPEIERQYMKVRNKNYGSAKEKTAALTAAHSQWLHGQDSNL